MNFALPKKNVIFALFLFFELAILSGWLPQSQSFWVLGLRVVLMLTCLVAVIVSFRYKPAPQVLGGAAKAGELALAPMSQKETKPAVTEGRDLACLFHEIRNCTSTLKGNTLLLKQKLPSGTDNSPLDRIERVTASIERIAREVMELADPSLVEPSRGVCLASVIKESITDYFPLHAGVFRLDIPEPLPILEGDPGKLRQAFINLYRNSLEAQATLVQTRVTTSGENVSVCIEDNGVGCSPSELPGIFLPLHTTKKSKGGMGLGLYLVKTIIENHAGTISASGRKHVGVPLGGLSIHLTLPVPRTRPSYLPSARQMTANS